jgi:prepilin-type N-terminal cleavage/methylation domain-containing protein
MLLRARQQDGFGMIELLAAMFILTIALLALMAGYSSAFLSLHSASNKSTAATLADNQLELYSSLPYDSIGLDQTTLQTTKAGDSLYVADEADLNSTLADPSDASDSTIAGCGSTPQCLPVQTVTGTDGRSYRLETFVRDVKASSTWTERVVTVIAHDPNESGDPELVRLTAGFDPGPAS